MTISLPGPAQWIRSLRTSRAKIADGARLTAALLAPLGLSLIAGAPDVGLLLGLGALQVAFADQGGSYRKKTVSMASTSLAVALAGFAGAASGGNPLLAVCCAAAGSLLCGLASLYGSTAANNSIPVLVTLLVTMGFPASPAEAAQRALLFLAGGGWAMVLSLGLWPFRPYGPSRDATAHCYMALGDMIRGNALWLSDDGRPEAEEAPVGQERAAVLEALQKARDTLTENRRTRQGFSSVGQDLLFLNANAEQLYSSLLGAGSLWAIARGRPLFRLLLPSVLALLEEMAETTHRLETGISAGGGEVDTSRVHACLTRLSDQVRRLREESSDLDRDFAALLDLRNLAEALRGCVRLLDLAADVTRALGSGVDQLRPISMLPEDPAPQAGFWEQLRDNLSLHSLLLRHTLRLSLATAAGVAVATIGGIERGYWIPMTVAILLKPDFGGTLTHAAGRTLGTMAGSLVGGVVDLYLHNPVWNYLLLAPLGVATFAQRTGRYGRFVAFLTLFIVLMLNLITPGDLRLPVLRVVNTGLGGVIAVIAGYVLWPNWERSSFPAHLARALAAERRFLKLVLRRYLEGWTPEDELARARAEALLEVSNASVSFQRLLSEPKSRRGDSEPYYALAVGCRQIFDAAAALSAHGSGRGKRFELAGLEQFAENADRVLLEFEEAVSQGRLAEDLPALEDALESISAHLDELVERRVAELEQELLDTPSRQALRDYAAASRLVHLLADELAAIDRALQRLLTGQAWEAGQTNRSRGVESA